MRNFLAVVGLLFLLLLGVGWFCGWYSIMGGQAPDGGRQLNIAINTTKIRTDLRDGKDHLKNLLQAPTGDEEAAGFVGPPMPEEMRRNRHPQDLPGTDPMPPLPWPFPREDDF